MKRVFLIGYMGAGKTTLGKALSKKSGLTFIDLDWYIEERYHKTIQQIFADHGEEGFREIEKNMLHEVSEFEDVIISTGGGTPCFFDNMDYMNSVGETVFLDVSLDVLFNRLSVARHQRPLLKGKSDNELLLIIKQGLEKRLPFYTKAKHNFIADELESIKEIDSSVQKLEKELNHI